MDPLGNILLFVAALKGVPAASLAAMSVEIKLAEVPQFAPQILKGLVRGRVVVNVNA